VTNEILTYKMDSHAVRPEEDNKRRAQSNVIINYMSIIASLKQGRIISIGGPGQSNALRPVLAREIENFNGQLNKTCRCICIVTTVT